MLRKCLLVFVCAFTFIVAQQESNNTAESNNTTEPLSPQASVVGGHNVARGGRPFQIFMQAARHFCGGSIISNWYILTAAHCTVGQRASDIRIIAGTIDRRTPYRTYRVSRVINHQNYVANSHRNDISLLRTSTFMQFDANINRIPLPPLNAQVAPGTPAVVSGWGSLMNPNKGSPPFILQEATIYVYDLATCRSKLGWNAVFDSNICAGDVNRRRGQCSGDSGGPLTANGRLVGVVSWSVKDPDCASPRYPGVYTKVSSYIGWINSNTR